MMTCNMAEVNPKAAILRRDYYEELGVSKNATEKEIKKAYRKV